MLGRGISGRRLDRFWAAVVSIVGCAVVAMTVTSAPVFPARALALVSAPNPVAATQALDAELSSPAGATAIASAAGTQPRNTRSEVQASASPFSGLVVVHANAKDDEQALALADAAARRLANIPSSRTPVTSFDFLRSLAGWDAGRSFFNLLPRSLKLYPSRTPNQLRVVCDQPACGPFISISGDFAPRQAYTASAFVRVKPSADVQLVMGAGQRDFTTSGSVRVGSAWTKLLLRWIPRRVSSSAQFAVQFRRAGRFKAVLGLVTIDGVGVSGSGQVQQLRGATLLSRAGDPRPLAALAGAAFGALMFGLVLTLRRLAAGRQHQAQ